jgi:hypothetical protein
MSATSSEVPTASAGGSHLGGGDDPQSVERTDHGTHGTRGHLGVERGCLELAVAEQDLDDADIDAVFQKMCREAVAQRMRADPLGDLRCLRCLDDDAMQLPGTDRLRRMLAREQPALCVHHALLAPELSTIRAAGSADPPGAWHCDTGLPCHARPGSACARCRCRRP